MEFFKKIELAAPVDIEKVCMHIKKRFPEFAVDLRDSELYGLYINIRAPSGEKARITNTGLHSAVEIDFIQTDEQYQNRLLEDVRTMVRESQAV